MPIVNIGKLIGMGSRGRTEFGQRLRDARKAAKLTQEKVREELGISQSALSELEQTGNSSSYTFALAKLYGCSAEWLATGEADQLAPKPTDRESVVSSLYKWPLGKQISPADWDGLDDDEQAIVRHAAKQAMKQVLQDRGPASSGKQRHSR